MFIDKLYFYLICIMMTVLFQHLSALAFFLTATVPSDYLNKYEYNTYEPDIVHNPYTFSGQLTIRDFHCASHNKPCVLLI
jgi:hypothetical protein